MILEENDELQKQPVHYKSLLPPLPTDGQALRKGGIPLFGKEGLGEIFGRVYLINYGLLSIKPKKCVSDTDHP